MFMSYMSAKWLKKDHKESAETSERVLNNYWIPELPLSTMSLQSLQYSAVVLSH